MNRVVRVLSGRLGLSVLTVLSILFGSVLTYGPDLANGDSRTLFLQVLRVQTSEEADRVARQIRGGESFDELAERHAPEGLRERKGYLGKVRDDQLHPEFREALSNLKKGEISDRIPLHGTFSFVRVLTPEQAASYESPAGSAQYYVELGLILAEISDEKAEIRAYEKAIELDPNQIEAYVNLGEVYRRKALRVLEETEGHQSSASDGAHEAVELLDEAINYFKLALEVDSKFAPAHYNLGLAYAAEGLLGLALLEFKEAAILRPNDGEIQKSIAAALYLSEDYEQAWEHVQRAKDMGANVVVLAYKIEKELNKRVLNKR